MKKSQLRRYFSRQVDSAVGELKLVAGEDALVAILWKKDSPRRVRLDNIVAAGAHPVLTETQRQIDEYFNGQRQQFCVPLELAGTPFQQRVWSALLQIPYGQTRSYAQIARQIGTPDAVRAVGAANGRNPISIIVPCHRVIGSTGKLTGFAGGLEAKAQLLSLETRHREAPGSGV